MNDDDADIPRLAEGRVSDERVGARVMSVADGDGVVKGPEISTEGGARVNWTIMR
jgi:hypothetical protein